MLKFSSTPLEVIHLKEGFSNSGTGAFACFEGLVRDFNDGQQVVALEYEAHEPLCQTEAKKIFVEAREKFSIKECRCFHRVGQLKVGEMAVWVGVTAAHRDSAFKACRYIIDEVKKRLPIWKKEYYANGSSGWIGCEACASRSSTSDQQLATLLENQYYSRQLILPEVGKDGQNKLKQANLLIVGAGGLGSSALMSLAAAGVGTIAICEFDLLDISNLHRQPLYSHGDVGKPKIDLAAKRIQSLNPFVQIKTYPEKLTSLNIEAMIKPYDILVDCTDNFTTKFLLNDAAVIFKKPLIQASIYQFEGQLRVYDPQRHSACLRCLWPEIPEQNCIGICTQAGVLGTVPAVLGNLQAMETIRLILNLPGQLCDRMVILNFLNFELLKVKQPPNAACPVCGTHRTITHIEEKNYKETRSVRYPFLSSQPLTTKGLKIS